MELAKIRETYRKALEARRKELEKELHNIDKELSGLGIAPIIRKKIMPADYVENLRNNPKNSEIFPIIRGYLEKRGFARAIELHEILRKAGYAFGGQIPSQALHTRMTADKDKNFVFDRSKGWMINNQPKQQTIHVGG